jgi:hypothetical protein
MTPQFCVPPCEVVAYTLPNESTIPARCRIFAGGTAAVAVEGDSVVLLKMSTYRHLNTKLSA